MLFSDNFDYQVGSGPCSWAVERNDPHLATWHLPVHATSAAHGTVGPPTQLLAGYRVPRASSMSADKRRPMSCSNLACTIYFTGAVHLECSGTSLVLQRVRNVQ